MTMTDTNATTYTAPGADLPVLFVVEPIQSPSTGCFLISPTGSATTCE